MPFNPSYLNLYPQQPGIYLVKDSANRMLYIGKAKNHQKRLKQYFVPQRDWMEMIPFLAAEIETIETIVTLMEKDALILENNLIKRHQPKFSVLLKDDKTFINLTDFQGRRTQIRFRKKRKTAIRAYIKCFGACHIPFDGRSFGKQSTK